MKSFLAAAVIASCASAVHAQTQVAVNGLLDLSVGRSQAPGAQATNGVDSGKMTTSWIGLRGSEGLTGSWKAVFALESFIRLDTGSPARSDSDTFWSRNAYVGLQGPLGTVTMGRIATSLFGQTIAFNAFGSAFGYSPSIRHYFVQPTTTGDTAWSDSVLYASPSVGPLRATVQVAAGEGNGGRNVGASLGYADGPLAAGVAWQRVRKGAAIDDTTAWQTGASWDLQRVKLYAQYGRVDNDSRDRQWKIAGIGAALNVTPRGKLLAQFGQLRPDAGARRDTLSLGYDHELSRRTDVYVVAMRERIPGTGSGQSYAVGARHRF